MERIRWTEKAITFRELVDNPAIQKPALVQVGTKSIVVGEKINGQFITASPCKISNDRFNVMKQEIVLSSKHPGIWRVISKGTSRKEGHIHRLTTKHIEKLYKDDIKNKRATPRSYICTKDIEAFELLVQNNDPTIVTGHRIDRRTKYLKENVEFEIIDIGEVEYTPTEGERTSQDFEMVPKNKLSLLEIFIPGIQEKVQLIRNRVLRTIYCTTKNETCKRRFRLEVNEQPCDIRPIASKGSLELRYLQSTQNLFDYMLKYGNDADLYVKLLRGDPPKKSIEFDGYMVLKNMLNGDKIPICRIEDLEVTLVNRTLPVRVKLPTGEPTWHSLPKIRAAELQCMQLSIALLARHESEMYVTTEMEKNGASFLQSNDNHDEQVSTSRRTSDTIKKQSEENERKFDSQISKSKPQNDLRIEQSKQVKSLSNDEKKISKLQTPILTRALTLSHPVSDKLSGDDEKRVKVNHSKLERQRSEQEEKTIRTQQTIIRGKVMPSPSSSSNRHRTKTNII